MPLPPPILAHITQYGLANHTLPSNWTTGLEGFDAADYLVIKGALAETTLHSTRTVVDAQANAQARTATITHHYVDDYYNRIHVIPSEIVTTVEAEETFYVWNSFLVGKAVVVDEPAVGSSFSITEFGRVDFRDPDDTEAYIQPTNIDDAYEAIEERYHTVGIAGEVAIDDVGLWTFTFDGEAPQSCTVSVAPLGLLPHWLFEVDTHKWSTKSHTWLSEPYLPRVDPDSFNSITMRYDLGGNLIAPSELTFEIVNEDGLLPADLEGEFILVKLILDTIEARRWRFKIDRAVEHYGKIQIKCVDFLQSFTEGDWPNTPSPKEVWLSDDVETTDDYCIPVILGAAYIPVRSANLGAENEHETTGRARYYALGESGPTYAVGLVRSPRNWPTVRTWPGNEYTMDGFINSGWFILHPIIAKSDPAGVEDDVGVWKTGDTFHDMLCRYTRSDTVDITNPARCIEYVLKAFGVPEEYIDDDSFTAAEALFDSQVVEFNGGWWQPERRDQILINLLSQVDAYLICTDKIEIYQFSATPSETFTNVLLKSFRPSPVTKALSDGARVNWPESETKPQDVLSGKALVPVVSGGTTTKPSSEILEACFLTGQAVNAQKAGILWAQKKFAQKNRISFDAVLSDVLYKQALAPGQVVTTNNPLYGGSTNLIITELSLSRDLKVSVSGVELSYLQDWPTISATDKAIGQDNTPGFSIGTTDYQGNIGENLNWSQIIDDDGGKPEDNATVGADFDDNLINIPDRITDTPTQGLNITTEYLGYYDATGSVWTVFIDDAGQFQFKGDDGNMIAWNGTALTLRGLFNAGIIQSENFSDTENEEDGMKIDLSTGVITVYVEGGLVVDSLGGIKINDGASVTYDVGDDKYFSIGPESGLESFLVITPNGFGTDYCGLYLGIVDNQRFDYIYYGSKVHQFGTSSETVNTFRVFGSITADGYITASKVADMEGTSLPKLENLAEWRRKDGKVDHEKHYAHVTYTEDKKTKHGLCLETRVSEMEKMIYELHEMFKARK